MPWWKYKSNFFKFLYYLEIWHWWFNLWMMVLGLKLPCHSEHRYLNTLKILQCKLFTDQTSPIVDMTSEWPLHLSNWTQFLQANHHPINVLHEKNMDQTKLDRQTYACTNTTPSTVMTKSSSPKAGWQKQLWNT